VFIRLSTINLQFPTAYSLRLQARLFVQAKTAVIEEPQS
jgi:hypothetical protein